MNLELPKQVKTVMDKLYEHRYTAYIHGECVRLLIKGQTPLDYDVITDANLPRIRAVFEGYHVIEDNLGDGELIVTVLGVAISVTSYTEFESSITHALARKYAFTFDAVAYSVKDGFWDPFGGLSSLSSNVLNFVQTGKDFNPCDIIPALAWQSGGEFTLSPESKKIVTDNADKAVLTRDDFEKLLMGRNIGAVLSEYAVVFLNAVPELKMIDFASLEHTFKSVGSSSPVLTLRYALLFHELGKPDCHSRSSDGMDFYYGHAERSRIYAARIMTRLECSPQDIKETGYIIENYQKVLHVTEESLPDLLDEHPPHLLKLLLLFNCSVHRAELDEKAAMKYKKLSKGLR